MNTAPRLTVVSNDLPDPLYPSETKANGWSPAQDIERIISSDTWVLAEDDERPWLLRVWLEAWRSVPVGSMPADRRLFARRIGCKTAFLEAHAEVLLRGWVLHSDGNLYHNFIVSQVQAMLEKRTKNREKLSKWRSEREAKQAIKTDEAQNPADGCNQLHGDCNQLLTVTNQLVTLRTGQDRTGQEVKEEKEAKASSSGPAVPDADCVVDLFGDKSGKSTVPACPHQEIIGLYHEILPEVEKVVVSRWRGSKGESSLRIRWREDERHQNLEFWRSLFTAVRSNRFWLEGTTSWKFNLTWLLKRENFDKAINRMVDLLQRERSHG